MPSQIEQQGAFIKAFDTFVESYVAGSTAKNKGLLTHYDADWPSPCFHIDEEQTYSHDDELSWSPSLRDEKASLSNLETALDITIVTELQQLFCRYYSHDLNAVAEHGALTILMAWNEEDFDRLQKNLISHVLMKRKLKQAETLFFALTDEDDYILSIMLSTGAVMLEKVGNEPHREIAPNLTAFMKGLKAQPVFVCL